MSCFYVAFNSQSFKFTVSGIVEFELSDSNVKDIFGSQFIMLESIFNMYIEGDIKIEEVEY